MKVSGMPRGIWLLLESDFTRRVQDQLHALPGIQKPFNTRIPGFMVISPYEMYEVQKHTKLSSHEIFSVVAPFLQLVNLRMEKVVYNCNENGKRTFFLQVYSNSMQILRCRISHMFKLPISIYNPKGPIYYIGLGYEGHYGRQTSIPTHTLKGIDLS